MKAVVQRVKRASVTVDQELTGAIDRGLLVFLGISKKDTKESLEWLAEKIIRLRIFPDEQGKMHYSVSDLQLGVLVVSQFTLLADCSQGRRPDFFQAAEASQAKPFYEEFIAILEKKLAYPVQRGVFGAKMEVELLNDGPVTLICEHEAER